MRSSLPLAVTRTPVRCGRVSSREAARATRAIVSTKAAAGTVRLPSAGGSGSFGKSSVGSVRRWNFAGPDTTSTSCSALRYSSVRSSFGSERTTSSRSRPGTTAWPGVDSAVSSATRTPSSMSVAWSSARAVLHAQEHAGERRNGTAGRRAAHGDAEAGEERFTGNGELQKMLPI